ncbi:MAG: hypothetical protein ACR2M9_02515 [Cyanophyceae cyanobacterium]
MRRTFAANEQAAALDDVDEHSRARKGGGTAEELTIPTLPAIYP